MKKRSKRIVAVCIVITLLFFSAGTNIAEEIDNSSVIIDENSYIEYEDFEKNEIVDSSVQVLGDELVDSSVDVDIQDNTEYRTFSGTYDGKRQMMTMKFSQMYTKMTSMMIDVDKNFVYVASDYDGLQKYDFSIESNPKLVCSNDIASASNMQTYGVAVGDEYLYAVTRTQGGDPSTAADVHIDFDLGCQSFNNKTDGFDEFNSTSGIKTSGIGKKSPLGGKYSCEMKYVSTDNSSEYSYIKKKISQNGRCNISFWFRIDVDNPQIKNGQNIIFNILSNNNKQVLNFKCVKNKDNTYKITPNIRVDNSMQSVDSTNNTFGLGEWYCFNIDYYCGDDETISIEYKGSDELWESDDWHIMANETYGSSNLMSPNEIKLGIVGISKGFVGASVLFDEVNYSTDSLFTRVYNQGKLDVLSKDDLTVINTFWFDSKATQITLTDKYLFVANQRGGMNMFSLETPQKPIFLGSYKESKSCEFHGMEYYSKDNREYLCVSGYFNGLFILDITDPSSIKKVANYDFLDDNKASLWDCELDYPYVYCSKNVNTSKAVGTSEDKRGLAVFNISDLNNIKCTVYEFPEIVKDVYTVGDGDARPSLIKKYEDYVFLANGSNGVAIFNVSDPDNCIYDQSLTTSDNHSVWAINISQDGRLFIGDGRHKENTKTKSIYMYRMWL